MEPRKKGIAKRDSVPIIVVLFHREKETRQMFKQLEKVTGNYSLIIVNNGFDDRDFLESLNTEHYIENEVNVGTIKAINQGLDVAEGKYIAVLHADLLIFEEGW
ncbi:MAG: glycosyltransferase, partial [Actinomycetota bacterium]|nr:glycosyltransferase [Actinomycetota bacterium]